MELAAPVRVRLRLERPGRSQGRKFTTDTTRTGIRPTSVIHGNAVRTPRLPLVFPSSMRSSVCLSRHLGGVDSKDSLLGANQIQGCFWEAALGVMDRLVLSDAAWERMAPLIIGRPDQKGSTGRDNRMFVEGVLWIVRTGSPWRDLPEVSTPERFCSVWPE